MLSDILVDDEYFMRLAIKEALKAYKLGETPVGAVVVLDNKVIAKAYNRRETKNDSTAHAEILALSKACRKLESWRLEDCVIYVTLEPCPMCAGAIIQARVKRVVYGAYNQRFGAHQGAVRLFDVPFNHLVQVDGGILQSDCEKLLRDFFKELRMTKNS